jgi:hypothetical protein
MTDKQIETEVIVSEKSIQTSVIKKKPMTQKERNEKFKAKHDLSQTYDCPVCFSKYTYFAKSNHLKSKRHLNAVKIRKDTTNILLDLKEI